MSELTTTEAAARVVTAVKARGYWPPELPPWVIALRQIVKLFEELCEAGIPVQDAFGSEFTRVLRTMAEASRAEFRDMAGWLFTRDMADALTPGYIRPEWIDWHALRAEGVDVLVTLRNLFAAIEAHLGDEFDADMAASAKAEADIARGTA